MIHILEVYERTSVKVLNKDKTSIFFNKTTPQSIKFNITHISSVRVTSTFEKYLDLPTIIGKTTSKSF